MWRYYNCDEMDLYSRYLAVGLYNHSNSKIDTQGKFGQYIKKRMEIRQIPHDLSITDMIIKRALIPDLFVELPSAYFISWDTFPLTGSSEIPEELKPAACHSIYIHPRGDWSLKCLLHPYDRELKRDFVDQFSREVPRIMEKQEHPTINGVFFRPYEAYFSYWKSYIFVEALDGYEDTDKFLSWETGRKILLSRFIDVSKKWEEKYKDIFSRLSFYRTAKTALTLWRPNPSMPPKKLSKFIQKITDCSPELLEQDMEKLLILFEHWENRRKEERRYYRQAIELLRQDIYFLLEWLCTLTNKSQEVYFKKWSWNEERTSRSLGEVLPYEEFELERKFVRSAPDYVKVLTEERCFTDAKHTYARLITHESFWPWIRAFYDLHAQLVTTSSTKPLVFRQPRILDHLLVLAIRTEILIRAFFRTTDQSEEPRELRLVFDRFSKKLTNGSQERKILGAVSDLKNWRKTELSGKPDEIFKNIDQIPLNNKWSKFQHHIFLSILRFVTARNYFAHHSFKDGALNRHIGELPKQILVSCLESVIYMDYVVLKLSPDDKSEVSS